MPPSEAPPIDSVELRGARIPFIGLLAHHYWLVVHAGERCERWEVWQRPQPVVVGNGHVHCDLLPWRAGVGGGDSWLVKLWVGPPARRLAKRARESVTSYPFSSTYRYWPGPNSNTYVQWLLGKELRLPWQAWGRSYGRL